MHTIIKLSDSAFGRELLEAYAISHPSVAVGYEEALGQRIGAHGLQEILQWHALAVHPEHHIKFHVIANSDSETTASESSCSMMSESLLMAT